MPRRPPPTSPPSPTSPCRIEEDLVDQSLERLNKKLKPHRRRRVFPNPVAAPLRLAGSVLVEAHDEWQVADKRYLSETSLALLQISDPSSETVAPQPLTA